MGGGKGSRMTSYSAVCAFLSDLGGVRAAGAAPAMVDRSQWRLGDDTLIVEAGADGRVRVSRVVVESASVDRVLDLLGDFQSRRQGAPGRRPLNPP